MTIHSMTAFARAQVQQDTLDLVCEMRSINHRYLEMSVHLPETLRSLEMPIRDQLRKKLQRGKVECILRLRTQADKASQTIKINAEFAKALCREVDRIAGFLTTSNPPSPTDILRFPGVLELAEVNTEKVKAVVVAIVDQALTELVEARRREGEELKRFFLQRLDAMFAELETIHRRMPEILAAERKQLEDRFNEAKLALDTERLEQELVLFAQKIDISEEIERTETHINEMKRVLNQGGAVGRRLDFLLQELNREANTMGSKSVDKAITHTAVEMKVLIEQIREQVQNVE